MRRMQRIVAPLFGLLLLLATPLAASAARSVEIRWDLTEGDDKRLTITATSDDPKKQAVTVSGSAAYSFVLEPSDRVVVVLRWRDDDSVGEINYAVTGTNVDQKDIESLKKLISGAAPAADAKVGNTTLGDPAVRTETKTISDDLIPAGKLTVTFTLKKKEGAGAEQKEVTSYTSGGITFRIKGRSPRITVSTGLALTTAPDPTIAIVKTSTLLSFEKDGKPQQAYEQMITYRDTAEGAEPIQALVTFANFQVYERLYATLGVQLNQKLFEEPLIGATYRHPLTETIGLNFTAGVHFSYETEILSSSGFSNGLKLDPTVGLTVEDIPTEKKYHRRFAFAFSIDF